MSDETAAKPQSDIVGFASFFKHYMSASTIVAAAAPIPVASLKAIPMYAAQRGYLTVYASMFSFLLLAFVFSLRHWIASFVLRKNQQLWISAVAFLAIAMSAACVIMYHTTLKTSLDLLKLRGVIDTTSTVLEATDYSDIPSRSLWEMTVYYLGIYLFAEFAFLLLAIQEFIQSILGLDEVALLRGASVVAKQAQQI